MTAPVSCVSPCQVINRDLSVAVLRHFVQQRREEIAAGNFKRPRMHQRPPAAASAAIAASDPAAASGQPPAAAAGPSHAKERARQEHVPYRPPEDIRILEGLAASGLRSIRYALEVTLPLLIQLYCHNILQSVSAPRHPRTLEHLVDSCAQSWTLRPWVAHGGWSISLSSCWSVRLQCLLGIDHGQIDGVSRVDANDLDEAAAEAIQRNLRLNEPRAAAVVRPSQGDVRTIALQVRAVLGASWLVCGLHWAALGLLQWQENGCIGVREYACALKREQLLRHFVLMWMPWVAFPATSLCRV